MLVDAGLTFREIVMKDPLPKATIQQAVIDFLDGRDDAALFGAMAVNAYVDERRMTEDFDIVSTRAEALAEELRECLCEMFHIAVRIRTVGDGVGYRLDQLARPRNRHLVDLRPATAEGGVCEVWGARWIGPPARLCRLVRRIECAVVAAS